MQECIYNIAALLMINEHRNIGGSSSMISLDNLKTSEPSRFEGVPDVGICRFASGEKELRGSSDTGISFYYFEDSDKSESYFLVVDGGEFSYWWNGADHTGTAPSAGIYASPKCINTETGENIVSLTTFYRHETYKISPEFVPEDIGSNITKTSQLENDSGFITLADLPVYGGEMENG